MSYSIIKPLIKYRDSMIAIYKANKDTLGIPFNRVFDRMMFDDFRFILDGDTLIGFCGLVFHKRLGYFEVEHLCIDKDYRGLGLSKLLLSTLYKEVYCAQSKTNNLLYTDAYPIIAYAVEGAENNKFYDHISYKYEVVHKKTMDLRKYFIDKEKLITYGTQHIT